jgi:site-specific DNA-methyltransferase (adenine-specific)
VYEKRKDYESAEKWKDWRLGNLRPLFEPILWFIKPYKIGGTLVNNILENGVGAYNYINWNEYNSSTANIVKVKSTKEDHGKHPTQKPIALMEALIKLTTQEEQIVLDPFLVAVQH